MFGCSVVFSHANADTSPFRNSDFLFVKEKKGPLVTEMTLSSSGRDIMKISNRNSNHFIIELSSSFFLENGVFSLLVISFS